MSYKGIPEGDEDIRNDINVIPLIDIMLVLLVIFMIAMPAISVSVRTRLTQEAAPEADAALETLELHILADGRARYQGETVSLEELGRRLAGDPRPGAVVSADPDVSFEQLARVLALLSRRPDRAISISSEAGT